MQHHFRILAVALALCAASTQAMAASDPLADCVDLAANRQAVRSGTQFLAIKDGENYYRVGFSGGDCPALAMTASVRITTDGTANRLCPQKSQVQAHRDSCTVTKVDLIDADDFARYKRSSR